MCTIKESLGILKSLGLLAPYLFFKSFNLLIMINEKFNRGGGVFKCLATNNSLDYVMKSSSTSSWQSTTSLRLSSDLGIGKEALITTSTRELVEFYWTNRKRFSGGYIGSPSQSNRTYGQ